MPQSPPRRSEWRETIESMAFMIAFLLLMGFEAQALVIPTGSMAPTLMGHHKEVTCPECGEVYAVNAHNEAEPAGPETPDGRHRWIVGGTCVNCRFTARIDDQPTFQGDRILLSKVPVDLPWSGGIRRWDSIVFLYPEEPEVRYIKRMVGLPDETLRIDGGDLFTRPNGSEGPFRRERRPLVHQQAMQMPVYDDGHRAKSLHDDLRWKRWSGNWSEPVEGTYRPEPGEGWSELAYRHVVPDPIQWAALSEGAALPYAPRKTLITDFYSYNTELTAFDLDHPARAAKAWRQPHWVGDLTLAFRLKVDQARGRVRVDLVKGGIVHRCELDLAQGTATLTRNDEVLGSPAKLALKAGSTYDVNFANVDGRLTLWVDGTTPFGEGVPYDSEYEPPSRPTDADLEPVRIAAQGADAEVSGLVLKRDIHYTHEPAHAEFEGRWPVDSTDPSAVYGLLADPSLYAQLDFGPPRDFPIRSGHYLMMGDNSPWSKDARAWGTADQKRSDDPSVGWDDNVRQSWEVPHRLLIGKAVAVYWPHAKPFGPQVRLGRDTRIPFRPYFERMGWIR